MSSFFFLQEKKESLSESQGAYRHLAGTLEQGRAPPCEPVASRDLLDSNNKVCETQHKKQNGSKLEQSGRNDSVESCEMTDVGPSVDLPCDAPTSENLLEGLASKESGTLRVDAGGMGDVSPDMQHQQNASAVVIPVAAKEVHLTAPKVGHNADSTNCEGGLEGMTPGASQNSTQGPDFEKLSRPQSSQPRLRIKIGGDSRSMHNLHEPGSKVLEEEKAVDVPIHNLHPVPKLGFNSQ